MTEAAAKLGPRPIVIHAEDLGIQVRPMVGPSGEQATLPVLLLFTGQTQTEMPLTPEAVRGLLDTLEPFAASKLAVAHTIPDLPAANGQPRTR